MQITWIVLMADRLKLAAMVITLLTIFSLTACGQKGALYLPEEPVSNKSEIDSESTPTTPKQGSN